MSANIWNFHSRAAAVRALGPDGVVRAVLDTPAGVLRRREYPEFSFAGPGESRKARVRRDAVAGAPVRSKSEREETQQLQLA